MRKNKEILELPTIGTFWHKYAGEVEVKLIDEEEGRAYFAIFTRNGMKGHSSKLQTFKGKLFFEVDGAKVYVSEILPVKSFDGTK